MSALGPQVRPYVDDDSVKMVRHDNVFVYVVRREFPRQFNPPFTYHSSSVIQLHGRIYHVTQHANSALRADGDEIRAGLRIVVATQAYGAAVMLVGVKSGEHPYMVR